MFQKLLYWDVLVSERRSPVLPLPLTTEDLVLVWAEAGRGLLLMLVTDMLGQMEDGVYDV